MIRVNIHDVKANLSRYLKRVANGEVVQICRRNLPVAEIRRLAAPNREPRPIGVGKGEFVIPPEFFDPLPEDVLRAFWGESS